MVEHHVANVNVVGSNPITRSIEGKYMTEQEIKLIDESIQAYKNMIKYHRRQILELERKKLVEFKAEDCPECFKFKIHKKNP